MPLEIALSEQHELSFEADGSNTLILPVVELIPVGDNMPHLAQILCEVSGIPLEIVNGIKLAYPDWQASNQPFPAELAQRLRQRPCQVPSPLPTGIDCRLEIKVNYYDSTLADETKPNLETLQTVSKTCVLLTPGTSPSLNQQLNSVIDIINPPESSSSNLPLQSAQDLTTPPFPGWLAIDFGTSNSTVTMFDPRVVPDDGLPEEQDKRVRSRFAEWFDRPEQIFLGSTPSDWHQMMVSLARKLDLDDPSQFSSFFQRETRDRILEAIRQIELYQFSQDSTRKAVQTHLNQIYHEVFREPLLISQSLIPIQLDKNDTEIPSELEVIELSPALKVKLGERVAQNRKDALANAQQSLLGRYHHSPKRYFGRRDQTLAVACNGKQDDIPASQLIQAAWSKLIELTQSHRDRAPTQFSRGPFNTAVMTYPTIAPPATRQQIRDLMAELGFGDVQTAYDEAISVAIFFLWKEFGGDLNIGIESFKTRCRQISTDKWQQNVLVLDVGGGTTDIALLELTLEEISVFTPHEDQGDGGRYYVLTPKVLGSSGHLHLGGELITLQIFLRLKVAIADCLLTAISQNKLISTTLQNRLDEMDPDSPFIDIISENGVNRHQFRSGSLIASLDRDTLENPAFLKDSLNLAEQILPTRWAMKPNPRKYLQTFYTLWPEAEAAKLKLGRQDQGQAQYTYQISTDTIINLLEASEIDIEVDAVRQNELTVVLSQQQFEQSARPVIQRAIGIAKGLVENRLNGQEDGSKSDQIDWLILSGKTCDLEIVDQELFRAFGQSKHFVWNPERVTFDLEYTKLATSAGACYAEKLRRLIFDPEPAKPILRKGANQLYVDVKNIFYYLPCAFQLLTQDSQQYIPIFNAGQELYQLNTLDALARYRTPQWQGVQLSTNLYRKDFDGMTPQLWGSFDGEALSKILNLPENDFRNHIKVKYEINQDLDVRLLLCRDRAYYAIEPKVQSLDVKKALADSGTSFETDLIEQQEHLQTELQTQSQGQLQIDISIYVAEGATVHYPNAHEPVFEAGKLYNIETFHYQNESGQDSNSMGILSVVPLPPPPKHGMQIFYARLSNQVFEPIAPDLKSPPQSSQNGWIRIGELEQPTNNMGYACQSYATLDTQGQLRLHVGEVPYWTSPNPQCLEKEGCVYVTELNPQADQVDETWNPFSGEH